MYTKNDLPIDAIISPEQEVASAFHRRIISPGTIDMVELSEKKLKLVGFKCEENCNHLGLTVRELSSKFPNYLANILFIFRDDKKFVVNSSTKLQCNALNCILNFRIQYSWLFVGFGNFTDVNIFLNSLCLSRAGKCFGVSDYFETWTPKSLRKP